MGLGFLNRMAFKPSGINLDGLIRYYKFDNDFVDATGNQDGVLESPIWDAGIRGNAARCDGNSKFGNIPYSQDLMFTDGTQDLPFTFSFFVNFVSLTTYNWIFETRTTNAYADGYELILINQDELNFWLFENSNEDYKKNTANYTFGLEQWYYITFTYNGNIGQFYVNGQPIFTSTTIVGDYNYMNSYQNSLSIMYTHWTSLYANARIDNLSIWNRALTEDEVAQLYEYELNSDLK